MQLEQVLVKPLSKGFSILEIALALAVISFLAYGLANNIQVGRDFDKSQNNQQIMADVKAALLTFAQVNGYLPCPVDPAAMDGLEDRNAATGLCGRTAGRLPTSTLGIPYQDAWGNDFFYAVPTNAAPTAVLTNPETLAASYFLSTGAPAFDLDTPPGAGGSTAGALTICSEIATQCDITTIDDQIIEFLAVAAVVSFGDNGEFTWNNLATVGFSPMEQENKDSDKYYWQASGSYTSADGFDDQLVWLTGYDIKYAMLRSENGLAE